MRRASGPRIRRYQLTSVGRVAGRRRAELSGVDVAAGKARSASSVGWVVCSDPSTHPRRLPSAGAQRGAAGQGQRFLSGRAAAKLDQYMNESSSTSRSSSFGRTVVAALVLLVCGVAAAGRHRPSSCRSCSARPAGRRGGRGHLGPARPAVGGAARPMAYVIIAVCFGLAGGIVGKIKGSSFFLWFLISGVVPFLGLIAAIAYRFERDELRRQCPQLRARDEDLRRAVHALRDRARVSRRRDRARILAARPRPAPHDVFEPFASSAAPKPNSAGLSRCLAYAVAR